MSVSLKKQLTEILLENKLITKKQLDEALKIRKKEGRRLGDILIEKEYITAKELMSTIGQHLGIAPINLEKFMPPKEVIQLIPKNFAKHYQIVPISKIGKKLSVAMADPLNVFAIDDVKTLTGLEVKTVISTPEDINQAVIRFYSQGTGDINKVMESFDSDSSVELAQDSKEDEINLDEITGGDEAPVIKIVNFLLVKAIREKVSDIHIEPREKKIRVRYRLDGVLHDLEQTPPKSMQAAIISRIKIMANLDIAERRLPQDGRIRIRTEGKDIDFRVSLLPTIFGEKIVMRILDKSTLTVDLAKLDFEESTLKNLQKSISHPHGIFLVTGPTGSGKTTTLYSALSYITSPEVNIITTEDPVEYQIEGICQVSVDSNIGLTFAVSLRSILRQDPDVVMVGEIRDFETADISIKAALTGHLVLSTLHTNDAASSLARLIDMGVEPFLVASSLIACAAQRLVRRLCSHCKESYEASAELIERLKIQFPDGQKKEIYKPKGCVACMNTGYRGRLALLELLVIEDDIKDMIIRRANSIEIKKAGIQNGMITLRKAGLIKVAKGDTSLEEVLRVTAGD
ncbi:type II secretion system ATPase GspE [PVC group bacterium]|nr:type II secretion system ATPase GspE [PVC group bacterium]